MTDHQIETIEVYYVTKHFFTHGMIEPAITVRTHRRPFLTLGLAMSLRDHNRRVNPDPSGIDYDIEAVEEEA